MQKCLELWASADDSIRIAAFLSVRKLALSMDESIMDIVLKVRPPSLFPSIGITAD